MFSLVNLLWLVLAGLVAFYWWQSGLFKGRARDLATLHCQQLGLQLLDQSMVIVGFWPVRRTGSDSMSTGTFRGSGLSG